MSKTVNRIYIPELNATYEWSEEVEIIVCTYCDSEATTINIMTGEKCCLTCLEEIKDNE